MNAASVKEGKSPARNGEEYVRRSCKVRNKESKDNRRV